MPIHIVCQGWDPLVDGDQLYPDDLPADWRLGYFANAVGAVYLPATGWADRSEQALAEWRNAVHAGFGFYLECPAVAVDQAIARAERALGDRLAGLIDVAPAHQPHAEAEPPRFRRMADVDALARAAMQPAAGLALSLPAPGDEHPRSVRQRLEALRRHCGPAPLLLVLEPPSAGTVLRWRTVAQLLGWP